MKNPITSSKMKMYNLSDMNLKVQALGERIPYQSTTAIEIIMHLSDQHLNEEHIPRESRKVRTAKIALEGKVHLYKTKVSGKYKLHSKRNK